jgi:ribonucleoside-diphosphate reductase alpha chain
MSNYNFINDELRYEVWKSKYQLNNESPEDFFGRIASEFARLDNFSHAVNLTEEEFNDLSAYGKSITGGDPFARFHHLFNDFKYIIPGGSVLAGIGSGKPVSLSNCFVLATNDSIEEIFDTASNMSQIYKRRGGVGVDLSTLRPNGALVNNAAKSTGGVVPFMDLYSQVTNTIGQSGRRGALMLSIDINHPDSPDFITSKQNLTKITGANISVKLNDEFKRAVENDEDYILRWPCTLTPVSEIFEEAMPYNELLSRDTPHGIKYYKKVKAKELWDSIIQCAWNTAEPGILFWDSIIDNDPASVYPAYKAVSTNPCGEIPLSPHDSCRLIATNLYSLVDNPFTSMAVVDEGKAYKVFYEAQIIGDILVDLELEAVQKIIDITKGSEQELWKAIKEIGQNGRRTGVGILGYGDMCAALDLKYGDEFITNFIMETKQRAELDATIDLAIINGSFPAYNKDLECISSENYNYGNPWYEFVCNNFKPQWDRMQKYGRRNISFSTIAPTGTISILAGTSSGCEPVFSLYYTRRKKCNPGETPDFIDDNGIGFKNYNVIHPKLNDWWKEYNKQLQTFPENFDLQSTSKEILDNIIKVSPWDNNCAEDIDPKLRVETQAILQRYTTHSISSTVNVAEDVSPEFIRTIYEHAWNKGLKGITVYRDNCRSGILIKQESQKPIVAIRPSELKCKVEQFKNEKKEWLAIIGLLDGKPYEIFTGPKDIDVFPIPSSVTEGTIIKVKHNDEPSRYDFRYIDSYGYTNTLGGLSRVFDKEYWNYGRLVSGYLRNNMPIDQIINIVDGLTFTNKGMNNWKSGVIRSLKPFIKDGTKVHGETCENCGSDHIVYEGGCKICKDCGSSKCG